MNILQSWTDVETAAFQKEIMTFKHNLNATGLFTDEALLSLLDNHPDNMLDVCTMSNTDNPLYPNRFRTGDFRSASSQDLLDAAKAGCVWINLRRSMNIHPEYKAVLDEMYGAIAEQTGNRPFNANGGILISSPVAKVPYHFDKTETILWHVRGKKRVYVYPLTQKFISDQAYETSMRSDFDDDLPYRREFDSEAKIFDLEEDQAITWPLNSPHRVDNTAFCVSVTTEYSTPTSAMKNAAMITNGILRRRLNNISGFSQDGKLSRQVKSIFGQAVYKSGLYSKVSKQDLVTFKIDSSASNFIADIPPFERNF